MEMSDHRRPMYPKPSSEFFDRRAGGARIEEHRHTRVVESTLDLARERRALWPSTSIYWELCWTDGHGDHVEVRKFLTEV